MKKIVTILGARPQFVKAAVVSRNIAAHSSLQEIIVHTGQHFDHNMSDVFFAEMEIPCPNYQLNIHGLNHGAMTGQMLEKVEEILLNEQPDLVLVYGDTNSTLAGALAAKKLHIPVAHVEAGLRSFNIQMPEEINRILTDRISNLLFCPTDSAIKNLSAEGYDNLNIEVLKVGDVMLDAALFYKSKARKPNLDFPKKFVLSTIHRVSNTDNQVVLTSIMRGLESIAMDSALVMPLHPRTRQKLINLEYDFKSSPIIFIDPVGYLEMIYLLSNCSLVVTDSGGLQKEAYFFSKNCLVVREDTEWTELVELGYNVLCGTDPKLIENHYQLFKTRTPHCFQEDLYGNGNAGKKIVDLIANFLTI